MRVALLLSILGTSGVMAVRHSQGGHGGSVNVTVDRPTTAVVSGQFYDRSKADFNKDGKISESEAKAFAALIRLNQ